MIRDDDLSYWTSAKEIDELYKPLFDKKIKISFATIPFAVKSFNLGNFSTFYQENIPMPIDANQEIVGYIKEKIKENLVEIMLHGYNHFYCFKSDGILQEATKQNLQSYRDKNKNIKFIGEFGYGSYEIYDEKIKKGKEYLEDIFGIKICDFVPPSNMVNKNAIKAISNNGLNFSGMIGKKYDREFTLKGLFSYAKRINFALKYKDTLIGGSYPDILNYGKHKELTYYSFTNTTNFEKFDKKLEFCLKNNYPFTIATHYWELKGDLRDKFLNYVDILHQNLKSKFLKEVFDE